MRFTEMIVAPFAPSFFKKGAVTCLNSADEAGTSNVSYGVDCGDHVDGGAIIDDANDTVRCSAAPPSAATGAGASSKYAQTLNQRISTNEILTGEVDRANCSEI